jgi:hypothetical protein
MMQNKKYCWVEKMSRDELLEFIGIGDGFAFQYKGKDYFVQGEFFDTDAKGNVGCYFIQDPNIQEDGSWGKDIPYPESQLATDKKEFLSLPFLNGKTILEAYNDINFFDN